MPLLIVDDSAVMRKVIAAYLRTIGMTTYDEAKDGPEALDRLRGKNYTGVFSVKKLEVGMVLSQDLSTEDGTILLQKKEVMDANSLERVSAAFAAMAVSRLAYVYREEKSGRR
ncbi:MAG: hypothetical protein HY900_16435 [Deltaproteobacteria bacterium]|nr:hypothetical protein [Deltaproteobacteria bacterium]